MSENQNTAITTYEGTNSIVPRNLEAQIGEAVNLRNALNKLFENLLEMGKDYDRIPGTDKPSLLKPGAEMLAKVFNLAPGKTDIISHQEDWENGIFSYIVGVPVIHIESGRQVGYGVGSANSYEKKHRYRNVYDHDGNVTGHIENPDPADQQNTLIKMAVKRAYVEAVLKATGASRYFTQDMEDFAAMTGQHEKASTKQVGFMKSLFRGVTDTDALVEISGVCGREIKSFDEIYRTEASKIIETKKQKPAGNGYSSYDAPTTYGTPTQYPQSSAPVSNSQAEHFACCADCGASVTKAEHGYSKTKFGRPLCRKCQMAAKTPAA